MVAKKFFIVIASLLVCLSAHADTVDIWQVYVNEHKVQNSNAAEIYMGHPMQLDISTLADEDIIKLQYRTDSGLENYPWTIRLLDEKHHVLAALHNAKNAEGSLPPFYSSDIRISVKYVKALLRKYQVGYCWLLFRHDSRTIGEDIYTGKKVLEIRSS